jgi:hypothetical protein
MGWARGDGSKWDQVLTPGGTTLSELHAAIHDFGDRYSALDNPGGAQSQPPVRPRRASFARRTASRHTGFRLHEYGILRRQGRGLGPKVAPPSDQGRIRTTREPPDAVREPSDPRGAHALEPAFDDRHELRATQARARTLAGYQPPVGRARTQLGPRPRQVVYGADSVSTEKRPHPERPNVVSCLDVRLHGPRARIRSEAVRSTRVAGTSDF